MEKKEDLRIRKTKANLYKGLLSLMENVSFEDIKVIDICKESMINRSTFYDHFNDKYELLASLIEDLKKELITHLETTDSFDNIKDYYLALIRSLLEYANKNLNIYSPIAIIKKNNNSIAYDMMFDATLETVTKHLKENYENSSSVPIEVVSLFYVSGVTKVLIESLKDVSHFDPDQILEYMEKLLPNLDYLKEKKD